MSYRRSDSRFDQRHGKSDRDHHVHPDRDQRGRDSGSSTSRDRDRDRDRGNDRGDHDPYRDRYNSRESDRDRDRDREMDRSRTTAAAVTSSSSMSKIDTTSVGKARLEPGSGVSSTAPFGQGVRPNPKPTAQDVSKAFRGVIDLGLERVELSHEEKALERLAKQKEDEHQRTRHRHGEYPVIGEMYQQFRTKQDKQREAMKRKRDQNDEKYTRLTDSLANDLVNCLPALVERKETQRPADPGQLRALQDRVNSISTSTDRHDINYTQLQEKQAGLENKNTSLGSQVKDLEGDNRNLSEKYTEMSQLLSAVHERMGAMEKTVRDETTAREALQTLQTTLNVKISALESENTKLRQDLLGQQGNVTTLQETLNSQKARADAHQTSLNGLRQDQAAHQARADSTNQTITVLKARAELIEGSVSNVNSTIQAHATTLSSLGEQIRAKSVDSRPAERASISTTMPAGPAVAQLRTDINSVRQSIQATDNRLATEVSNIQTGSQNLTRVFGKMVDDLRKDQAAIVNRVAMLEASLGGSLKDQLSSSLDQIKGLHEKYEMMAMAITSLDHQMNNMTTKELAEHIMGHMESIVPNARQLQNDVQAMGSRLQGLDTELDQKMELKMDRKMEQLYDSYTANYTSTQDNMRKWSHASKKRRIDSVNNVDGNGVANGHQNANGDPSINGVTNGHGH